jgi:glutamyl-Q tRNA(Asp) synthetase
MPPCTRFAPSPTGLMHLGHALAARVARDLARADPGGRFLLRFEDIDSSRVRPEYYAAIETDLRWLGLDWDGEALRQSVRSGAYRDALERLVSRGLVYPCFCTRAGIQAELARMVAAPHGSEGPHYPGSCRALSPAERSAKIQAGQPHAWRLDVGAASMVVGPLDFDDLRHGRIAVDPLTLGDVVLARKDIGVAYHLAVVIDDAWQEVSHVTRGDDLLPATHVHRVLQELLGLPRPIYLHHPLVLDSAGRRLAKRNESLSLAALRAGGATPEQILARIPADAGADFIG